MKNGKFKNNLLLHKYFYLLLVLSMVIIVSVVRYAAMTYKVSEWDEQIYMSMATQFYRFLHHLTLSTPLDILQFKPDRQIFYPLSITSFLMIFGLSKSYFWGQFINGLFYVATIFGIYFLSKNYLSKLSAFLASLMFASYGWTLLYIHLAYEETAVSALVIWSIYSIVKSNFFKNKKYSILFGIFLALSILTRWISVIFISGPVIFVIFHIVKGKLYNDKKILINLFISISIVFLSFYPYLLNSYWVKNYFFGHRVSGPMWQIINSQERNPFSLFSLTFYLNTFNQLGVYYLALIIFGFILTSKRKNKIQIILFTTIIPWFFLSFFSILKADRFIIPIFPYLSILSASVFDSLKKNSFKTLLTVLTVCLACLSFLGSFWAKGPMKQSLYFLPINLPFGQFNKIYLTSVSNPPYIYKISGKEILDFIYKDSEESGIKNPKILSLFYYRHLASLF